MTVASLRVALMDLSPEEWRQILDSDDTFQAVIQSGPRAPRGSVKHSDVLDWLRVPARSNRKLPKAVLLYALRRLMDESSGEDPREGAGAIEVPVAIPESVEQLKKWLAGVASDQGRGPARVCLLAAREHHGRDGLPQADYEELERLVISEGLKQPAGRVEAHDSRDEPSSMGATRPTDQPVDPPQESGGAGPDLETLEAELEQLREDSRSLAEVLGRISEILTDGADVPSDFATRIEGFRQERADIFGELGAATQRQIASFEDADTALSDIREEQQRLSERQQRQAAEEKLLGELSDLDEAMDGAPQIVVDAILPQRQATLEKLDRLRSEDEASPEEPAASATGTRNLEPPSVSSQDVPSNGDSDYRRTAPPPGTDDLAGDAGSSETQPDAALLEGDAPEAAPEESSMIAAQGIDTALAGGQAPPDGAASLDQRQDVSADDEPREGDSSRDLGGEPEVKGGTDQGDIDGTQPNFDDGTRTAAQESLVEESTDLLDPDDQTGAPDEPHPEQQAGEAKNRDPRREDGIHPQLETDLAHLIDEARPMAAWWLAVAALGDTPLTQALRFHAIAFSSGPGRIPGTDALVSGWELDAAALEQVPLAAVAALTGSARASLVAGWSHPPLLGGLTSAIGLNEEWQLLVDQVIEAIQHEYVHQPSQPRSEGMTRANIGTRAAELKAELEASRISYQRATRVLHRLLRHNEPIGRALDAVAAWGGGNARAIADVKDSAALLKDDKSVRKMIDAVDELVASPKQRRNPIEATARHQLEQKIESVKQLIDQAIDVETRAGSHSDSQGFREHLRTSASQVAPLEELSPLANAMLGALSTWILSPDEETPGEDSEIEAAFWRASLPMLEAQREQDGLPRLDGLEADEVRQALLAPVPVTDLVEGYVDRGDLQSAGACAEGDPHLEKVVQDGRRAWPGKLRRAVRDSERVLARTRNERQLDEELISSAESLINRSASYSGDRYDLVLAELGVLESELTAQMRQEADRLEEELAGLEASVDDEAVVRIRALLGADDLATAREYIYLLRSRQPLPAVATQEPPILERFKEVQSQSVGVKFAAKIYEIAGGTQQQSDVVQEGLYGWKALERGQRFEQKLPAVLQLLGIEQDVRGSASLRNITEKGTGDSKTYQFAGTPKDRSIVPALGSGAARYTVTQVGKDRIGADQILQLIPESRSHDANLLLIPRVLEASERRGFLAAARKKDVTALVIDSAVVGFIAAVAPGSFATLQEVTLPFSSFSHYTPAQSGVVPDEVFVGRTAEERQIVDKAGSLFVYGGRQLGKSALLRRISRKYTNGRDQFAVYVDLRAKMIGEARDPSHLWSVLLQEFKDLGIIGKRFTSTSPEKVVEQTRKWLNEDENRRILLLLDEADLFLESEARERREGGRTIRFANLQPLKELMESTERRFKPVFAGLHQVQRFQDISNTPLAHGGKDIPIGPLDHGSALELVEEPMRALGYQFANRDLIFRLLAFTNYQANLIQIVCDRLIGQLSKTPPAHDEPPRLITEDVIDRVIDDPDVRHYLAERFRLTIQLEDRYLVIALVLAVLSFDDQFKGGYSSMELLEWCREYWADGFDDMTLRDFELYLDEMQGLGVLIQPQGAVRFRSPNVVAMLGSESQIKQQLDDYADRFELPHDFNPRASRRVVRDQAGRELRSPLTEQDLRTLLPLSDEASGVFVVLGSPATGIENVIAVLESVAPEKNLSVQTIPAAGLSEWLTDNPKSSSPRKRQATLVLNAIAAEPDEVEDLILEIVATAQHRKHLQIVLVVGPAAGPSVESRAAQLEIVILERWNSDALRSLGEGVFAVREHRERALAVTSGWPELVEEVHERTTQGEPLDRVLETLSNYPQSEETARRFLREVGVPQGLGRLVEWASVVALGEPVDPEELDEMYGDDGGKAGSFVALAARLQTLGVMSGDNGAIRLDPVVHRALHRLGGS